MFDYLLLILSAVILAFDFALNKLYQKKAGTSLGAGLKFNIALGLFTAVIFLAINKFRLEISLFSILMASAMSILAAAYNITGFKIMSKENVALYTFFLMTGGMSVPYIWGLIFLNDPFSPLRTVGLVLIASAIYITNSGSQKISPKQLLMCMSVFFLNGFVSVVSKEHQISPEAVSSIGFVTLTGITKTIICSAALILTKSYKDTTVNINLKSLLPIMLLSAVLSGTAYLLQLIGAKNLPATILYPIITGGTIIFSAVSGWIFYKEKITKKLLAGIILCFIGTCMFL